MIEAVGRGEACCGELPEPRGHLLLRQRAHALQVGREGSAAIAQQRPETLCLGRKRLGKHPLADTLLRQRCRQPVSRFTQKERNGRGARGDHATRHPAVVSAPRGMWRDASPAHDAGQAQVVEPARIVVPHTCRQQRALPLGGGRLEAFQLLQRGQHAFFPGQLRLMPDMLPVLQPAIEDHRGDRLDGLTQTRQREPVYPLQDATLTPLHRVGRVVGGLRPLIHAAHRHALHFHHQQRLCQGCGIEMKKRAQVRRRQWTQQLQPALHKAGRRAIPWRDRLLRTVLRAGQRRLATRPHHGVRKLGPGHVRPQQLGIAKPFRRNPRRGP